MATISNQIQRLITNREITDHVKDTHCWDENRREVDEKIKEQ